MTCCSSSTAPACTATAPTGPACTGRPPTRTGPPPTSVSSPGTPPRCPPDQPPLPVLRDASSVTPAGGSSSTRWFNDATGARPTATAPTGPVCTAAGRPPPRTWSDITAGYTDVTITRGNDDGAAAVDVTELDVTWYDPDWAQWDVAPPAPGPHPFVGDPMRVSFYDPQWALVSAGDRHDRTDRRPDDRPHLGMRIVTVQAFGNMMDLTATLPQWQRPAELASARFAALLVRRRLAIRDRPGSSTRPTSTCTATTTRRRHRPRRTRPHRPVGRVDVRHRPVRPAPAACPGRSPARPADGDRRRRLRRHGDPGVVWSPT